MSLDRVDRTQAHLTKFEIRVVYFVFEISFVVFFRKKQLISNRPVTTKKAGYQAIILQPLNMTSVSIFLKLYTLDVDIPFDL